MDKKIFIGIIGAALVLAVAFLSQQPQYRTVGSRTYIEGQKQGSGALERAGEWFRVHVYPRVSLEVKKRGVEAQKEITQQKDAVAKNLWGRIKIYFAEKFSNLVGVEVE